MYGSAADVQREPTQLAAQQGHGRPPDGWAPGEHGMYGAWALLCPRLSEIGWAVPTVHSGPYRRSPRVSCGAATGSWETTFIGPRPRSAPRVMRVRCGVRTKSIYACTILTTHRAPPIWRVFSLANVFLVFDLQFRNSFVPISSSACKRA